MEKQVTKHTPGPWRADSSGVITGGEYFAASVCTTTQHQWERAEGLGSFLDDQHRKTLIAECKANADLIVRACNSHADLLAACEAARAGLNGEPFDIHDLDEQLQAAIEKAKTV